LKSCVALPARPAPFVQLPVTCADALSGPLYVIEEHDAIPETSSLPENVNVTGWLYHPATSGDRSGAAVTVGGVVSILTSTDFVAVSPAAFVALQVSVVPVVSDESVVSSQPDVLVIADSASVTVQVTVTALVNHSFVPSVPTSFALTRGGDVSASSPIAPEASTSASSPTKSSMRRIYEPS
jgi:hypothetical protein